MGSDTDIGNIGETLCEGVSRKGQKTPEFILQPSRVTLGSPFPVVIAFLGRVSATLFSCTLPLVARGPLCFQP